MNAPSKRMFQALGLCGMLTSLCALALLILDTAPALAQTTNTPCANFPQSPQSILVTSAIPSSPLADPRGIFFTKQLTVTLRGGECIALASSSDGRGSFWVNDTMDLLVQHTDGTKAERVYDFRSPDRTQVTPFSVLEVSQIFAGGENRVTVSLHALSLRVYGSSTIYLAIFAPPAQATALVAPNPVTSSTSTASRALTPASITTAVSNPTIERVSFAQLNAGEITMRGPIDASEVIFSLPADWQMSGTSQINLNFNTIFPGLYDTNLLTTTRRAVGGLMQVSLNNTTLGTIVLDRVGENFANLSVSNTLWATASITNPLNSQVLSLRINTAERCDSEPTTVIVHPSSDVLFSHLVQSPVTDLKRMPYPIFQNSFFPETAILVMPNEPTPSELQAMLTVAAGLGRMTGGKLQMTFITDSQINDDLLKSTHLIFVGKPAAFTQLSQVTLPVPVNNQGFTVTDIAADEGVLEMALSPWNNIKVVLVVGGQSDSGVIKASQAVSSGLIRTGNQDNLAVVVEAQPITRIVPAISDHPLADLGYGTETRWGPGVRHFSYLFEIPYGQSVNADAYFDLVFSHAASLNFDQSDLSVLLNGQFVGSLRFSDRTTRVSTWRVNLPRSGFQAGTNTIELQANLQPSVSCVNQRDAQLWFNVRPESSLRMPLGPSLVTTRRFDLSMYPSPFVPNLDRTAIVVAEKDPIGWATAGQLAFDLGRLTEGAVINLAAAYANNVPDALRQQRDLLLVGRPIMLPIMSELYKSMPGPFESGSDIATELGAPLKFRISKDTPVGYLEVFAAPWKADRTVMAVVGNSNQGLNWASTALVTSILRGKLNGNFAVVIGDQIIASRITLQPQGSATPVVTTTQSTPAPTSLGTSELMLMGGIGLVVLILVAIIAFTLGRRQKAT